MAYNDCLVVSRGVEVTKVHDCSVLVVDDDSTIRAAVSDILELEGYLVSTATNGAEALREVERGHPNVVILDMRMPVMDGWSFARELHRRDLSIPLPKRDRSTRSNSSEPPASGR